MANGAQVEEKFHKLQIQLENYPQNGQAKKSETAQEYVLPIYDVYKLALSFYKEKEGKAVHFSYEDKLSLVAFSQQVLHGPLSEAISKLPPLGTLDVVGRDRRLAWQKLGNLDANEARAGFVELLSRRCPLFIAYVEAHAMEKHEQDRLAKEAEERKIIENEVLIKKEAEERIIQEELQKEEAFKRQIQQALNEQTYDQFRNYAEQQYPGDPEKQGALIRQLQDQHYIQYIQQLQTAQRGELIKDNEKHEAVTNFRFKVLKDKRKISTSGRYLLPEFAIQEVTNIDKSTNIFIEEKFSELLYNHIFNLKIPCFSQF